VPGEFLALLHILPLAERTGASMPVR
jgi:hypothetical protein